MRVIKYEDFINESDNNSGYLCCIVEGNIRYSLALFNNKEDALAYYDKFSPNSDGSCIMKSDNTKGVIILSESQPFDPHSAGEYFCVPLYGDVNMDSLYPGDGPTPERKGWFYHAMDEVEPDQLGSNAVYYDFHEDTPNNVADLYSDEWKYPIALVKTPKVANSVYSIDTYGVDKESKL